MLSAAAVVTCYSGGARRAPRRLTQQLARNLTEHFGLTNEKSFERKIREILVAIQIEKRYTKREIFTIYCNQMRTGARRLRRRGGSTTVLRQVEQGTGPRRGGPHRRYLSVTRAAEPLRRHAPRHRPPQSRAATDG